MAIVKAVAGDQIESAEDLAWCLRTLLEDTAGQDLDITPLEGVRAFSHYPREFLVGVRMGSQVFRVTVADESD
jgi:hypothetical protein